MFEAIHDHAVDAIITIDETGVIELINPATKQMFGYSEAELCGQNVKILMPPPYRDEHDGYLSHYLTTGVRKIIGIGREVVGKRKDKSEFPIHLAVSEIKIGDRRLFAGIIRDLTEFNRLEEQQTTLGRIIEDSLNEVYIFDADTMKFILANRGARENLGYGIEELRRMQPSDIKPDFDQASFRQLVQPLVEGQQEKLHFETTHQRKDGSTYDVDVYMHLSSYLNRAVFVAIILDVTERRRAQRLVEQQREVMQAELQTLVELKTAELREAQAELVRSEKFSTLGKVSGGIAHEIRNPLNAIKTSAYYLLNANNPSDEKIAEHLDRIDRQVSLIDNVVTALSDVARLPEANLKPVDIASVLRAAVHSIQLPAGIVVEYDFAADLPPVMVDDSQIVIAIKNLIRNARDAMPEGGTLTIRARPEEENLVSVSVGDTGIGIEPEQMNKIMEPLFTTKARGIGLGLAITVSIIEKNRGSLAVESRPGEGSCFTVLLNRECR